MIENRTKMVKSHSEYSKQNKKNLQDQKFTYARFLISKVFGTSFILPDSVGLIVIPQLTWSLTVQILYSLILYKRSKKFSLTLLFWNDNFT